MLTTACSQAANGARMQLPSMISQSFPKYMGPFVTLKIAHSACAPGSKNILGVPSGKQGSPMIRFESLSFSLVRHESEIGFQTFSVHQKYIIKMSDTFQRVVVLYRAIVSFVSEIGFISSKCKQFLIADDGFSGIQIGYLFYQ